MLKSKIITATSLLLTFSCFFSCANKKNLNDVVEFTDSSVNYDGLSHLFAINIKPGVERPSGLAVTYSYQGTVQTSPFSFVNSGLYTVVANVAADNYESISLSANLNIVGKEWPEIHLSDVTSAYNSSGQYLIDTEGFSKSLPEGSEVKFCCKDTCFPSGVITIPGLNVGKYPIKAIVNNPMYRDSSKTFEASLTINKSNLDESEMKYHFVNTYGSVQDLMVDIDHDKPEDCPDGICGNIEYLKPGDPVWYDIKVDSPTVAGEYSIRCLIEYTNYNTYDLRDTFYFQG